MSDRFDERARETIAEWLRLGYAVEPQALAALIRDTERRGELKGLERQLIRARSYVAWAQYISELQARIAELKKGEK